MLKAIILYAGLCTTHTGYMRHVSIHCRWFEDILRNQRAPTRRPARIMEYATGWYVAKDSTVFISSTVLQSNLLDGHSRTCDVGVILSISRDKDDHQDQLWHLVPRPHFTLSQTCSGLAYLDCD